MATITIGLDDIVQWKHSPDSLEWRIEGYRLDGSRVDLIGISNGNDGERMHDVPVQDIIKAQ